MRLDVYLTENGMCKSRAAAQRLISDGGVLVNGEAATKNSAEVSESDIVTLNEEKQLRYVGRGGLKLEHAIELWNIELNGVVCVDVGASTGGFTDCMLKNGAELVYAVDVGKEQLDESLKRDERVISLEQTDIREFSLPDDTKADFIGADVSFISLKLILPHIYRLLKDGGNAVVLIKPQFEAGKSALSKKGVVRDEKTRMRVVEDIKKFAEQCGFAVIGMEQSPITGGDGNVEYLMLVSKGNTA